MLTYFSSELKRVLEKKGFKIIPRHELWVVQYRSYGDPLSFLFGTHESLVSVSLITIPMVFAWYICATFASIFWEVEVFADRSVLIASSILSVASVLFVFFIRRLERGCGYWRRVWYNSGDRHLTALLDVPPFVKQQVSELEEQYPSSFRFRVHHWRGCSFLEVLSAKGFWSWYQRMCGGVLIAHWY